MFLMWFKKLMCSYVAYVVQKTYVFLCRLCGSKKIGCLLFSINQQNLFK